MNSFVITIYGNKQSEAAAQRCMSSSKRFGVESFNFWATVPKDDPVKQLAELGIPTANFYEKYSRPENCMSAFLSHYKLWEICQKTGNGMIIFEHDAVVVDDLPVNANFDKVMNIGKPSYGRFNVPTHLAVGPLVSKPYFPGAHAYMIKPQGAKALMDKAKECGGPTDIFLNIKNFPWLQEFNPWPVECRDSFTTIQNETGCLAKHNYAKDTYEIV